MFRPDTNELFIVNITRQKVVIPSVESKILDNNIGYIALSTFSDTSGDEFESHVANLKKEGTQGLVIDLRNNG